MFVYTEVFRAGSHGWLATTCWKVTLLLTSHLFIRQLRGQHCCARCDDLTLPHPWTKADLNFKVFVGVYKGSITTAASIWHTTSQFHGIAPIIYWKISLLLLFRVRRSSTWSNPLPPTLHYMRHGAPRPIRVKCSLGTKWRSVTSVLCPKEPPCSSLQVCGFVYACVKFLLIIKSQVPLLLTLMLLSPPGPDRGKGSGLVLCSHWLFTNSSSTEKQEDISHTSTTGTYPRV